MNRGLNSTRHLSAYRIDSRVVLVPLATSPMTSAVRLTAVRVVVTRDVNRAAVAVITAATALDAAVAQGAAHVRPDSRPNPR